MRPPHTHVQPLALAAACTSVAARIPHATQSRNEWCTTFSKADDVAKGVRSSVVVQHLSLTVRGIVLEQLPQLAKKDQGLFRFDSPDLGSARENGGRFGWIKVPHRMKEGEVGEGERETGEGGGRGRGRGWERHLKNGSGTSLKNAKEGAREKCVWHGKVTSASRLSTVVFNFLTCCSRLSIVEFRSSSTWRAISLEKPKIHTLMRGIGRGSGEGGMNLRANL